MDGTVPEISSRGEAAKSAFSSPSAVKAFCECPEKYRLSYIERFKPRREPANLQIGTWVHSFLEAYYREADCAEALQSSVGEAKARILNEGDAKRVAENEAILRGVAAGYPVWAEKHDRWKVKEVEKELQYQGLNMRIDLLVEVEDGPHQGLWVVEHKTHALGRGDAYEETAAFAIQPLAYCAATGARGIVYNLVAKPAIRQRQNEDFDAFARRMEGEYTENIDKYFSRRWVFMENGSPKKLSDTLSLSGHALRSLDGSPTFPRNENACMARGRCQFLPLCQGRAQAEDLFDRKEDNTDNDNRSESASDSDAQ